MLVVFSEWWLWSYYHSAMEKDSRGVSIADVANWETKSSSRFAKVAIILVHSIEFEKNS